jgi:hypothetical protein
VSGNEFTGGGGVGWVCGANRRRDTFISNRYSGLTTNFTDNGLSTIVFGTRENALRTNQYMQIGGLYFGEGTTAPPTISGGLPDGSMYNQSGVGVFTMLSGSWVQLSAGGNAAWAKVVGAYSASITPLVTACSFWSVAATDGTAFTINAPTGAVDGQLVMFRIVNTSGGVIGNVTWVTGAGGFSTSWSNSSSKPGNGHHTCVMFAYDATANIWNQAGLTADLA